MKMSRGWVVALAVVLAACGGGGGDAGTSPFDPDSGAEGPRAADLTLVLSAPTVDNSGSHTIVATATAVDASRVTLADISVAMEVDSNATLTQSSTTTDADGKVTGTVSIGNDRSNRLITVTARSGELLRTATFRVTGADLEATALPAVINPSSTGNKIVYRLVDVNKVAMTEQPITVSAPGVADVTGSTDLSGSFEYSYTAPAALGSWDVTATAGGVSEITTLLVQPAGGGVVPPAVGVVESASVTANPSVIAVSTAETSGRSEIRALFVGANNQPIMNVRARFILPDPNNVGGSVTTGDNVVYSNVNGVATSAYISGTRSSPTNGVIVRVCYDTNDFAAGTCPNAADTTLTVSSEALAVTIGFDNTISSGLGGLTYIKKFAVFVVDSSGQAKAGVQLKPSIDLVEFLKGSYHTPQNWTQVVTAVCPNEDVNRNGVLETGEDLNSSGTLDPRKADVAIRFDGPEITDASGAAVLQIEYPKNLATWVRYSILVSASGVAGTEGRDTLTGTLPADAESFKSDVPPAFVLSRYGQSGALPAGMGANPSGGAIADGCYNRN